MFISLSVQKTGVRADNTCPELESSIVNSTVVVTLCGDCDVRRPECWLVVKPVVASIGDVMGTLLS